MKLPRLIATHFGLAAVLLISPMAAIANVSLTDAKNELIDKQQKMTQEEMDAAKKAAPVNDLRPAATTTQKAVDKATDAAEAAKPAVENRPAVTTDYK
jgi:hypothetical protein